MYIGSIAPNLKNLKKWLDVTELTNHNYTKFRALVFGAKKLIISLRLFEVQILISVELVAQLLHLKQFLTPQITSRAIAQGF